MTSTVTASICLSALCLATTVASEAPLGHKDFYPSDARPVGFQGDGNGAFPGATPVTKWSEGQVERQELMMTDNRGRTKESREYVVLPGTPSTNIAWKAELPGWTESYPIVVGDRAFVLCDPHWLVCFSMQDGSVLWQRDNIPFALDGMARQEAEAWQEVLHMARADFLQRRSGLNLYRQDQVVERFVELRPDYEFALGAWKEWRAHIARLRGAQDILAALDAQIEALQQVLAEPTAEKIKAAHFKKKFWTFSDAVSDHCGFPSNCNWTGMVGFTMAAPVSDGRHVYAVIGQGQTVCYDLAGRLVWGRLFKDTTFLRVQHVPSPLLIGNLLVAQHATKLRALDKRTGATVWEADVSVGNGYNVGTHKHLRLPTGDGTEDVILTTQGRLLRAADGKELVKLPFSHGKEGGGPSILGEGDRIVIEKYWGHGEKNAKGRAKREGYWMARLGQRDGSWSLIDPLLVPGYEKRSGGPPAGPVFHQGRLYGDLQGLKVVDADGTVLSETTARGFRKGQSSPILAGSHLIQVGKSERYHRPYPDQKMYADFLVVDVSDPSKMTVTSMYNMLGGVNVPHVPCIDKYLPHWIDRSDPTKCRFGNYAVPPQFGGYNAGLFASGNRLLILGMSHLYCIGDPKQPYDWNPASRPAEIRAMLE